MVYGEERECINPRAGDAHLWLNMWEESDSLTARKIAVELEHVKAHRTKKEKKDMSHFEKLITEGNEKVDELARARAMLHEGFMYGRSKSSDNAAGARRGARSFAVCSQLSLLGEGMENCEELKPKPKGKWIFVDQGKEETKHRTEWCAETNKDRCKRCGKSSTYMKKKGKCIGPIFVMEILCKWRKRHLGGHDVVRRMNRQGEVLIWCRKCSGFARQRMGPKLLNCCKPEQVGTKEYGKMIKRILVFEDGRVPPEEARNWEIQGQRRRITKKGVSEACELVCEVVGFMAQQGLWNFVGEKMLRDRGALLMEEGDVIGEYKATHEEHFLSSLLREERKDKEENILETDKETDEETSKTRTSEEERERRE